MDFHWEYSTGFLKANPMVIEMVIQMESSKDFPMDIDSVNSMDFQSVVIQRESSKDFPMDIDSVNSMGFQFVVPLRARSKASINGIRPNSSPLQIRGQHFSMIGNSDCETTGFVFLHFPTCRDHHLFHEKIVLFTTGTNQYYFS